MQDIVIDDIDLFDSIELPDDASPADRALHEAAIATLLQTLTVRREADGSGSLMVVVALGDDRFLEWHAALDGPAAADRVVVTTAPPASGVRTTATFVDRPASADDDDAADGFAVRVDLPHTCRAGSRPARAPARQAHPRRRRRA